MILGFCGDRRHLLLVKEELKILVALSFQGKDLLGGKKTRVKFAMEKFQV